MINLFSVIAAASLAIGEENGEQCYLGHFRRTQQFSHHAISRGVIERWRVLAAEDSGWQIDSKIDGHIYDPQ